MATNSSLKNGCAISRGSRGSELTSSRSISLASNLGPTESLTMISRVTSNLGIALAELGKHPRQNVNTHREAGAQPQPSAAQALEVVDALFGHIDDRHNSLRSLEQDRSSFC